MNKEKVLSGLREFSDELHAELSTPLVTSNVAGSISKLREQLAKAQSYAYRLSSIRRDMEIVITREKAEVYSRLKEDDEYKKANVGEKKIIMDNEIADLKAHMKHLERTEEVLSTRCTTAQSLLKSMNNEEVANRVPAPVNNKFNEHKPIVNNPFD